MPLIIANLARTAVMSIVTGGGLTAVQNTLDGTLKDLVQKLKSEHGITDDEAWAVAQKVLQDLGINTVTVASLLWAKIPSSVARWFGFTGSASKAATLSPRLQTIAAGVTATAAKSARGVKNAASALSSNLQTVFLGFLVIGGWIDFANWETGAYSDTFQKIFATVTFGLLKPNEEYRQTKTVSPEVFSKIYNAYKLQGATSIQDPIKGAVVPFTRDNLIELLDPIGAKLLSQKGTAKTADVIKLSQMFIVFGGTPMATTSTATSTKTSTTARTSSSSAASVKTTTATAPAAQTLTLPQVYTGFVSNGTLGNTVAFVARQDDLIENDVELRSAAQTNIAAFAASLPGRVFYEISILKSVKTRGGNTLSAGTQQIITGYYKNGNPKYKTVYNMWAVADIFIDTDTKPNVKVTRIVLGPTNGVTYRPQTGALNNIAGEIRSNIVAPVVGLPQAAEQPLASMQIDDATQLSPETTAQIAPQGVQIEQRDYYVERDGFYDAVYYRDGDYIYKTHFVNELFTNAEKVEIGNYGAQIDAAKTKLLTLGINVDNFRRDAFPYEIDGKSPRDVITVQPWRDFFNAQGSTSVSPAPSTTVPGAGATNLYEWYNANDLSFPPLATRAVLYESKGLGAAAYYAGTAEQNTKLLNALKESGL